jgi:uncharacterized GH25 family protein
MGKNWRSDKSVLALDTLMSNTKQRQKKIDSKPKPLKFKKGFSTPLKSIKISKVSAITDVASAKVVRNKALKLIAELKMNYNSKVRETEDWVNDRFDRLFKNEGSVNPSYFMTPSYSFHPNSQSRSLKKSASCRKRVTGPRPFIA